MLKTLYVLFIMMTIGFVVFFGSLSLVKVCGPFSLIISCIGLVLMICAGIKLDELKLKHHLQHYTQIYQVLIGKQSK